MLNTRTSDDPICDGYGYKVSPVREPCRVIFVACRVILSLDQNFFNLNSTHLFFVLMCHITFESCLVRVVLAC